MLKSRVQSVFFFFKQKTAYELRRGLVGSEMCIRDSLSAEVEGQPAFPPLVHALANRLAKHGRPVHVVVCLLYTSDAADDLLCVDLGGRRLIKKNKQTSTYGG